MLIQGSPTSALKEGFLKVTVPPPVWGVSRITVVLAAVLRTGDNFDVSLGHPHDTTAAEEYFIDFTFKHGFGLESSAMVEKEAKRKRWHVLLKGIGVGFPSPETLHQDLIKRAGGAMEVLDRHDFEVHGPSNVYRIDAPASFDAETIKDLVSASVRVYVPESASYTVVITSTQD